MDATRALEAAKKRRRELADAAAEVEDAAARPKSSPDWPVAVAAALAELDDAFRTHCDEVEADGGLFDEIAEEAPRLEGQISELRRRHAEIACEIERVRNRCGRLDPDDIRTQVASVLGMLSRHRQQESDLVWEAYMVDIGGWS